MSLLDACAQSHIRRETPGRASVINKINLTSENLIYQCKTNHICHSYVRSLNTVVIYVYIDLVPIIVSMVYDGLELFILN